MYRHYITIDEENRITNGWSTGEHPGLGPGQNDVLLTDKGGVTFALLGIEYPILFTDDADKIPLYAWESGAVRWRTQEEIDADRPDTAAQERESRISELKRQLADTDYAVIKIAEGAATAEEYADVIALRQAWRAEINELEAEE